MLIAMYTGNESLHFGKILELNKKTNQFILRNNSKTTFAKEEIMKNKDFVLFFEDRNTYLEAKQTEVEKSLIQSVKEVANMKNGKTPKNTYKDMLNRVRENLSEQSI